MSKTGRSYGLILLGTLQAVMWSPYLLEVPDRAGTTVDVQGQPVRFPGSFDLGTALYFLPASVVLSAALLTIACGWRPHRSSTLTLWSIRMQIIGAAFMVIMQITGLLSGVIPAGGYLIVLAWGVPYWFAVPAIALVLLLRLMAQQRGDTGTAK